MGKLKKIKTNDCRGIFSNYYTIYVYLGFNSIQINVVQVLWSLFYYKILFNNNFQQKIKNI